jgi:hypothetical protein
MHRTPTAGRFAVLKALTGATALALLTAAPFADAQSQGDMAGPPVGAPAADPADVATIDGMMKAFYESTAGPAGQPRDWDRLLSLCSPQTRYIATRPLPDGGAAIFSMTVPDFIQHNRKYFENGGFFETEAGRQVQEFGNIAHVWSVYESRRQAEAPVPYSRGIYSIQMLYDQGRWTIVSVFWDHEREDNPIPEAYLGFPEE